MGGNGNSADYGSVNTNAPLIETSALGNGSWDGHVTGYALGVAAGTATYSFNDATTNGAHVIAAEFLLGPPPPLLTLQVNIATGATLLFGDEDEAVSITYYELKSAGNSLTTAGWSSLADQDYDGNGPANGSGNGWEEAGGADTGTLAEAYLLSNSTIPASGQISLGSAYQTAVDAQDLTFRYLTSSGKIYDGIIEYLDPAGLYAEAAALAGLAGPDAEPAATPFSDGVKNLLKYAFNMNLGGPDFSVLVSGTGTSGLPIYELAEEGGEQVLRVEYLRRRNSGLIYVPMYSTDLNMKYPMTGTQVVESINDSWERVTASQSYDLPTTPRLFGMVKLTLPE
jgi:hypothetical protein